MEQDDARGDFLASPRSGRWCFGGPGAAWTGRTGGSRAKAGRWAAGWRCAWRSGSRCGRGWRNNDEREEGYTILGNGAVGQAIFMKGDRNKGELANGRCSTRDRDREDS